MGNVSPKINTRASVAKNFSQSLRHVWGIQCVRYHAKTWEENLTYTQFLPGNLKNKSPQALVNIISHQLPQGMVNIISDGAHERQPGEGHPSQSPGRTMAAKVPWSPLVLVQDTCDHLVRKAQTGWVVFVGKDNQTQMLKWSFLFQNKDVNIFSIGIKGFNREVILSVFCLRKKITMAVAWSVNRRGEQIWDWKTSRATAALSEGRQGGLRGKCMRKGTRPARTRVIDQPWGCWEASRGTCRFLTWTPDRMWR